MTVLAQVLDQPAILWARSGTGADGQPAYAAPSAIVSHWDEGTEEVLTPGGERRRSVATALVSADAAPGSMVVRGTLGGGTSADPRDEAALEVLVAERWTVPLTGEVMRRLKLG